MGLEPEIPTWNSHWESGVIYDYFLGFNLSYCQFELMLMMVIDDADGDGDGDRPITSIPSLLLLNMIISIIILQSL